MPAFVPTYDAENRLAEGMRTGSREVFNELYKLYAPVLMGYISRLTNDDKASEEALQKTFIDIWNNRMDFDPETERLFTWMLRITKSITLGFIPANRYLTNKKINMFSHEITEEQSKSSNSSGYTLSMMQEHLLNLMHYNNYSLSETAAVLRLDENIVRSALRTAISKLKTRR